MGLGAFASTAAHGKSKLPLFLVTCFVAATPLCSSVEAEVHTGSEVTQRQGAFAVEHDKLSSSPRTQALEGENILTKVVLCLPYVPQHVAWSPKWINARNFKCKLLASWLQGARITLETGPGRDVL